MQHQQGELTLKSSLKKPGDTFLVSLEDNGAPIEVQIIEVDLENEVYYVIEPNGTHGEIYFDQANVV